MQKNINYIYILNLQSSFFLLQWLLTNNSCITTATLHLEAVNIFQQIKFLSE